MCSPACLLILSARDADRDINSSGLHGLRIRSCLGTLMGVVVFTLLLLGVPAAQQDRAFNDRRYYIGSSKLGSLGWVERTTWEEGLQKTIDW